MPIATGVLLDVHMAAVVTEPFVAPKRFGAALAHCLQDPELGPGGDPAIARQVRVPILVDNIGHFQGRAAHDLGSSPSTIWRRSSGLGMACKVDVATCR
jgi:hypothetical protein